MATNLQFDGLPKQVDSEFRSVVNLNSPELSDDGVYHSRDKTDDQRRHAPYVSFGDVTVTATSGAFGFILRISQYVDRPDFASKMLVLDYTGAPAPFCIVARADDLMGRAQSHRNGFGLRISQVGGDNDTEGLTIPSLTFLGDRWPQIRYSINDALEVRVDPVCRDHMVLQRMRITNESSFTQALSLEFDPSFLLRDLDYTTPKADVRSDCLRSPHGRYLVMMEQPSSNIRGKQLCVVIVLYKDGVPQELNDASILPIKRELNYRASHDAGSAWKDFVIPSAEVNRYFEEKPVEFVDWEWPRAERAHTRWSLHRNLEHILGVCSVQISTGGTEHGRAHLTAHVPSSIVVDEALSEMSVSVENNDGPQIILETPEGDNCFIKEPGLNRFELQKMNEPRKSNEQHITLKPRMTDTLEPETPSIPSAISLTCGDFGDHRVCVPGSYFAFVFILKMHQQARRYTFQNAHGGQCEHAQKSMRRIHETCRGHLQWLSRLVRRDALSSNLWVDGTSIASSLDTTLPPDSPANMPYHILKNRLSPTWEHLQNMSDIPIYCLSDHTWVWKALHDIQELIHRVQEERRKIQAETGISKAVRMTLQANHSLSTGALDDFLRDVGPLFPSLRMRGSLSTHALDFTVEDMMKKSLRRFTLENDVLKERMLSVTRSARETRFLFHSRDTVLYYGQTWGFLKKDQLDLFEQLVKAQVQHDEEGIDEAGWDNPLRYALALLMAQSKHQLDLSHRDEALDNLNSDDSPVEASAREKSAVPHNKKSTEISTKVLEKAAVSMENGDSGAPSERLAILVQRSLKRQNPHGRLVDISNIVEVSEEWLYKDLLSVNKQGVSRDFVTDMKDATMDPNRYSFIEDVQKSRKQHKRGGVPKSAKHEAWSFKDLWEYLKQRRYAASAKKRFIYLNSVDPARAMICCFFDRHGKSKPYLYDDTAVALNSWVTEVYFQFFNKHKHGQNPPGKKSAMFGPFKPSVGDFFDRYWTKVLELILLSRILEKVCTSSEEILDEVERKPNDNQNSVFQDEYDSLEDRSPVSLQECERILLLLKKNMISLREVIDQWDVRESSQGRECPRWTRPDEQKYRKSIKQKQAVFEGHVRDVRAKEIHIEFLLTRVTSTQKAIRSKKSLREAENITLFTYVTVFFLLAGLAVSIFSMGDIPSRTVFGWMVLTAVVALVITASLFRMWKSGKPTPRRSKARDTNTVTDPGDALKRPDDGVSTEKSLKGTLFSLIRLDTRGLNDDLTSKHV
ncbi:hypothetical protein BJX99DRAFT_250929 [Aspergillus californicus]